MGYGTDKGGQMHYYDELYDEVVLVEDKRDYPYQPAISCIDEDNLEQLADDLGVEYVHMDRQDRIDPILDDLVKYLDAEEEESYEHGYMDTYYYFVLPLTVLVAYEFVSVKRRA